MPVNPKSKTQKPKPTLKPKAKAKAKAKVRAIDEKRLEKLLAIKAKLEQGTHVQNRDLQTWLTKEEFAEIEAGWEMELERRENLYGEKPDAIREYETRLARAILLYSRADYASQKQIKTQTASNLMHQSNVEFERALAWLEESLGLDPSLQQWLDRAFDASVNLDPDSVPRVVTSRSIMKQGGISKRNIADIKFQVVSNAIAAMQPPANVRQDDARDKVRKERFEKLLNLPNFVDDVFKK